MRHNKQTVSIATHERLEQHAKMLAQSEKKAWEVVEQKNMELTSLQAKVDDLAARVAELEAPGECASIHKLQAQLQAVKAERDAYRSDLDEWLAGNSVADLVAERDRLARIAESRDLAAIIAEERADAVAADRKAAGKWIRGIVGSPTLNGLARSIEHGDHVDDSEPLGVSDEG